MSLAYSTTLPSPNGVSKLLQFLQYSTVKQFDALLIVIREIPWSTELDQLLVLSGSLTWVAQVEVLFNHREQQDLY